MANPMQTPPAIVL
ncbi:hypothetical protein N7476_006800 [Penicillium atrosanguineum]|uniref:Uncharacterized protein n=1 Tax=Penicillium atrosanguineum TaxID=1132637 RepID=A0A9W9PXV4_9EURO|nr:hypothetical protein N7476_006800 [Penicillium atrosanguineum]